MRTFLIVAVIFAGLSAWPVSSGVTSSALLPPSSSQPPRGMSLQHVIAGSLRHRVPIKYLLAIWQRECSSATICKTGDSGQSFGPFQVQETARLHAGCVGKWRGGIDQKTKKRGGPDNADCAARILRQFYDERGTWRRALAAYKSPAHRWDKPNAYVLEIEAIIRGWQLTAYRRWV